METGKDQQAPHHLLVESPLMQMANDRDQAFKEHWTNRFVSSSNLESVTRKGLASTGIRFYALFTSYYYEGNVQCTPASVFPLGGARAVRLVVDDSGGCPAQGVARWLS